ncbi:MAG TPA: hypothetical protein VHR86_00425, partial [Armatimonadota bacterium]|nr:hypothetical protein [Armatimonadota bacterium]
MSDQTQTPRSDASRYHHTELSRRAQFGISLGWASLVLLLGGLISYAGNNTLTPSVKVIFGLGILLGVGYLAIRKDAACAAVFNARTGSRANSTVAILAVVGILGFANYIATRHTRQFDSTRNQLHTLSPQTRDVLKGLKEPITITAFYQLSGRGGMEGQQARELL